MILLKNITLRNFLSIGAVTQGVDFNKQDLTLILGENLDLGGDGARNGTGKTTLIQGLSYAMFGVPINNIRKDNLVNRTNGKGMLVTLEFSVDGVEYKIERGRKPNILRFYINDERQEKDEDNAQGENKETQSAIEKVINMSPDMFRHIVALNTYSEPFLALRANEQRDIIEQLLGITMLSEKADIIKTLIRESKDKILEEEFRIKAVEEANKRVREQIESLKRRQSLWSKKHNEDLITLVTEYDDLCKIDIEKELLAHKELVVYNELKKKQETHDSIVARQIAWQHKRDKDILDLEKQIKQLSTVDITKELQSHKDLVNYVEQVRLHDEYNTKLTSLKKDLTKEEKTLKKLIQEVKTLEEHRCYACGQEFHDDQHTTVLSNKQQLLDECQVLINNLNNEIEVLKANPIVVGKKPITHYKTEAEAIKHSSEIDSLKQQIENKLNEADPYHEQLIENPSVNVGSMPMTHYDSESEAIKHSSRVDSLLIQITNKNEETDPYNEQIVEMESQALQEVNFDNINDITKVMEHQKFLLDLLTSKDSFVRKKIIDQNLSYLNARLTHYLDKIGLPHQVIFQNDLNVEITELGREMDFHNLSRGEMNRVILALSWSFRDVWENLYSPINVMFIDELLDNGTDTIGVENSLGILKDMCRTRNKSVWLVSHKEELINRVSNVLKVVKENGFSSYDTTTEIV